MKAVQKYRRCKYIPATNNLYQIHVHYQNTTYLLNVDNVPEHILILKKFIILVRAITGILSGFIKLNEFQETDDLAKYFK